MSRPCMVNVHELGEVINKHSLFDVSEHQDGAIRILYQSRTCNNIMQGSEHVHSHCNNDDECQYRYGCIHNFASEYRMLPDMIEYSHSIE